MGYGFAPVGLAGETAHGACAVDVDFSRLQPAHGDVARGGGEGEVDPFSLALLVGEQTPQEAACLWMPITAQRDRNAWKMAGGKE